MSEKKSINLAKSTLGIEFGSTRVKAVLIDEHHQPIASGGYEWENDLIDGVWTYALEDVWSALQHAYRELADSFEAKHHVKLNTVGAIGFSGMMHGYLPFDKNGKQLVPFRTWRNTMSEEASQKLSERFHFNIPQRWSVSHLYQAILNQEAHVGDITFLTTLAGYVHWQLTGEQVLGIGEASGMFPIDSESLDYDSDMMNSFDDLIADKGYNWQLKDILPHVLAAGETAGQLSKAGARLLDPTGVLEAGIPFCPPEGDAGTGMVATNSVAVHTGNVSAGTSIFSMVVLDKPLSDYYVALDMVTTPAGDPVAMVHCNNFSSDINDWVNLFTEVLHLMGTDVDTNTLFTRLYQEAQKADDDQGKMVSANYYSGEPITGFEEGRPLLVRMPDSKMTVANFMQTQIYAALATLRIGMDILTEEENVQVNYLLGHGGFFKTEAIGQQMMADALHLPISVMETAGEGGPWGMALLASYTLNKHANQSLADYLNTQVFSAQKAFTLSPDEKGIANFNHYLKRYQNMLAVERAAVDHLKN